MAKFFDGSFGPHARLFAAIFSLIGALIFIHSTAHAQDTGKLAEEPKVGMKADKTGANPINFTHDLRLYNEYIWLNTAGDGYQNITTLEYRQPIFGGKWQFRTRIRGVSIEADLNNDGIDDVDEGGLGELAFRLLTVPIMNMKKKFALAVGFETFLPTAQEPALGSQRLSFGPQVFAVFFAPFGIKGTLIAPAYQHKFSVWEDDGLDDLHQGLDPTPIYIPLSEFILPHSSPSASE